MRIYEQLKEYSGALTRVSKNTEYSYKHIVKTLKGDVKHPNPLIKIEAAKELARCKKIENLLAELEALEVHLLEV
jgi:predicted negative regulator of RcsB-dependent stress response